jgi:Amt family ammonium transporter
MLDIVSARDKDLESMVAVRTMELEAANNEWRSETMLRRQVDRERQELHCVFSFSAVRDEAEQFQYSILQVNDITESKRLSSELAYQARHDMLTGLANRRVVEQALQQANDGIADSQQPYVLMLMDLDRFKIVNDSCGHAAGDNLLKQLSAILVKAVRPDDIVARLGGDEFAILLLNCSQAKACEIAEAIRAEVEAMVFQWEGQTFRIGTSIGLVEMTGPQEDTSVIMRRADAACYSAKDGGRNQVFVAPECEQEFVERQGEVQCVRLINDAIDNNDFILFGQPVLPLQDALMQQPSRVEVLLRVRDRSKGKMLPPGAFFPIAERYGLCSKVDRWVVGHLLHTLDVYRDVFEDDRRYWVNLSGQSLSDNKFLTFLESIIREANLPPGVINFEITETEIIRNINEARTMMKRLKEFGCQFALDDFGSGLSSFGYLKKLPVDYIKIDGLFVKDILDDAVDRAFVDSIIKIAGIMGIQTVAEFVESMEVAELLKEMGADYGQGFALGRPSELLPASATRLEDAG